MPKPNYGPLRSSDKKRRSSSISLQDRPHASNGDIIHNVHGDSDDERLDELDPLRDPTAFEDDSDDGSFDDIRGSEPRLPHLRHRRYGSEKGLSISRAYENRPAKRSLSQMQKLVPKRSSFCTLFTLGIVGLVLVLALSGFWAHKQKEQMQSDHEHEHLSSPPWYPAPPGGTMKRWEQSYKKAEKLVRDMTLVEKVNITTGTGWSMGPCVGNTGPASLVGFPSLCLQDGPQGLRWVDHITAGPPGITVGTTWNKQLMRRRGRLMGQESRAKGVNVLLGPAVGPLGRSPLGGRNWEGFGSDPVLQGIAAAETVKGIQEEGVMATIKHFVGNEQEHFRQENEWGIPTAISSNMDDRTLHEIYAWPFADSIRAGVVSVMCSYNQVNNSFACQNSKLLNGILKDELGFQGFVQSDWLAQRSGVASALAGLDMSMPGDGRYWQDGVPYWGFELTKAVVNGTLPIERVDDMVTRIVASWFQVGQDAEDLSLGPPNFSSWTNEENGLIHPGSDDETVEKVNWFVDAAGHGDFSHTALSRRVAAEAIVLLKNDNNLLPLNRDGHSQDYEDGLGDHKMRIAIIGEDAVLAPNGPNQCFDRACNEGTLATGWGSGAVEFPYLIAPFDALQHAFNPATVELKLLPTNDVASAENADLENQDKCIVFVNSDAGEGFASWNDTRGDRNNLFLQKGGDDLIAVAVSRCGLNSRRVQAGKVIVVIHAVGPVIMESFIENENVGAVLFAGLPGQESGNALTDVMFGHINPSGHLPFTIGKSMDQYGRGGEIMYEPNGAIPQVYFDEGTLIDYRWFDAQKVAPRFEFGFGKSYSEFRLNNLKITPILPYGQERPPPTSGLLPVVECAPPKYDSKIPAAQDLVFPSGWRKLKKFIYSYLENAESAKPGPEYPYPEVVEREPSPAGGREGGHPALWDVIAKVEVDVTNLGLRDGSAVVQAYLIFPDDVEEGPAGWLPTVQDREKKKLQSSDRIVEEFGEEKRSGEHQLSERQVDNDAGQPATELSDANGDPATLPVEVPATEAPGDIPAQVSEEHPPAPPDEPPTKPLDEVAAAVPEPPATDPPEPHPKSPFDLLKEAKLSSAAVLRSQVLQHNLPTPVAESMVIDGAVVPIEKAFTGELHGPTSIAPASATQTAIDPLPYNSDKSWASELSGFITGRKKTTIIFAPRQLRGFEKVHLRGAKSGLDGHGERKKVVFELTRRDFSYWSVQQQNWVVPDGSFGIEIGFSSRDLRVRGRVF